MGLYRNELLKAEMFTSHFSALAGGNIVLERGARFMDAMVKRKWGNKTLVCCFFWLFGNLNVCANEKSVIFIQAFRILHTLLEELGAGQRDWRMMVDVHLELSELFLEVDQEYQALPHALTSLTLSTTHHLTARRDRAGMMLADVLLGMGEVGCAKRVLEGVVRSVGRGDGWEKAMGELLWGECRIACGEVDVEEGFERAYEGM